MAGSCRNTPLWKRKVVGTKSPTLVGLFAAWANKGVLSTVGPLYRLAKKLRISLYRMSVQKNDQFAVSGLFTDSLMVISLQHVENGSSLRLPV